MRQCLPPMWTSCLRPMLMFAIRLIYNRVPCQTEFGMLLNFLTAAVSSPLTLPHCSSTSAADKSALPIEYVLSCLVSRIPRVDRPFDFALTDRKETMQTSHWQLAKRRHTYSHDALHVAILPPKCSHRSRIASSAGARLHPDRHVVRRERVDPVSSNISLSHYSLLLPASLLQVQDGSIAQRQAHELDTGRCRVWQSGLATIRSIRFVSLLICFVAAHFLRNRFLSHNPWGKAQR